MDDADADGASRTRNVSFSPTKDYFEPDERGVGQPPAKAPPVKSALKRRNQPSLPPPALYQHADPLLRRLRLYDGYARPVNLKEAFRDTELVMFLFGSQWGADASKGTSSLVADLCREYVHKLKVIYISVDTDKKLYDQATYNKPWLSMEWHDGSSEDAVKDADAADASNESFLLAGDVDLDEYVVHTDKSGNVYARPFSRVYMADKMQILMTPALAVYHVPTRKFLDRNVRISRLRMGRAKETIAGWLAGKPSLSFHVLDAVYLAPWTTVLVVLAIFYSLLLYFGGEQYNVRSIVQQFL
ncbi:hypothetical protein MVES1_002314 [Malassezia vespertilionis]|uniref:Thioredoxin-like fold domain-containing protein n=1 Tax=Malassezia vespertilionis TaxID=2020962 RepID=A0A2N1JBE7_9BASI|nr:uncharacterized protein MVES1_002314 [Malassezia vespertilionis]PKI83865.1 hypothetical protein MVES_002181 [Malassezia vespertilionis]WFD06959.1 hypothetical protein MVES1_002314 [Malassezia vespertilionis]